MTKSELMSGEGKRGYINNIIECARLCVEIKQIILLDSEDDNSDKVSIAIIGELPNMLFNRNKGYMEFRKKVFEYDFFQDCNITYFKDEPYIKESVASCGIVIYDRNHLD